jgi:hypothetical protein
MELRDIGQVFVTRTSIVSSVKTPACHVTLFVALCAFLPLSSTMAAAAADVAASAAENRAWCLAEYPESDNVERKHFALVDIPMATCSDGEVLVKTTYISGEFAIPLSLPFPSLPFRFPLQVNRHSVVYFCS